MSSTKHFVLIHGASHGAWCWYKVRCQLQQHGHKVTCIDLAGAGLNLNDPKEISSFDEYNRPLFDFMSALPDDEKVVLVGHSAGGLNVTSTIREFGSKVETAVYVAANMLRNGFHTPEDIVVGTPDLSELGDRRSCMRTPGGILMPEYQRLLLFNLSPAEDITLACMLMRPFPKLEPIRFAEDGGQIDTAKRVYVKAQQDMLLKPKQQDAMIRMWPPSQVFSLESDHSPFFSAPSQLCDILLKV